MSVKYQRPPIKVALVGLGRAMFFDHYPVFKAHPALFKVAYACDLEKDRRDVVAADFPDCKMFRRLDDLLDEHDIDLVDIATPSVDHVEHAMMALERGFWTMVESPIALTFDAAQRLRGAAVKTKNRLLVVQRGLFAPDFLLAQRMINDPRLGAVYDVKIRKEDYIRRYDWQTVKRVGGGAAYYAMPDLIMQALKLLPTPPIQMWSELKRIASVGDAEDMAHVNLKTRTQLSADIEFNGGVLRDNRSPSFEIRAERGVFRVMPNATQGELVIVDPKHKFAHRRSTVRLPEIKDMHEDFPVVAEKIALPRGTLYGPSAFWKCVYDTVRTAAPFPVSLDDSIQAVKFAHLMKRASPFGA